jgi:hypothetical protein
MCSFYVVDSSGTPIHPRKDAKYERKGAPVFQRRGRLARLDGFLSFPGPGRFKTLSVKGSSSWGYFALAFGSSTDNLEGENCVTERLDYVFREPP